MEHYKFTKQFTAVAKYCSLIVMSIGLFVLTGWALDISAFKTVLPGFATMKANLAFAFFVAGAALWSSSNEHSKQVTLRIVQISNGVALLIGLLTLSEYIFELDLGIDQLLFRDLQTSPVPSPGRMAFASALCLSLISTASILIHMGSRKNIDPGQSMAVTVLAISLLALVGYIYGVQALYKLDQFSSMALHTAAGFILLAIGTLCVRPHQGWMRILSTETAGGVILRQLLPVLFGIPIFIGWLIVLGDRAGLYETHFGLAMLAVLTAGFLIITIWLNSRKLNLVDVDRKRAEEELRKLNIELEHRVAERTAELKKVNDQLQDELIQREQLSEALLTERDLLQTLMDNIPDTIYFKDTDSRFTRINRAQAKVLGVAAPEEATGKTDADFFAANNLAKGFYEEEQEIVKSGKSLTNRIEFNPTPDGQPRWFSATKVPIRDENGKVTGIVGISRDITQQMQSEEALRQNEAKLRAIFDTMSEGIALNEMIYSEKGEMIDYRVLEVNQAFYSTADYIGNEVVGNMATKLYGMSSEFIKAFWEAHKTRNEVQQTEYYSPLKNRSFFVSTSPFVNDRFVTSFLDITERRQVEEDLRHSEERFRLATWATKDAIWDWNLKTDQISWGAGLQKIFGYSSETSETGSEWWLDHIHPQERDKVSRSMKQALEGGMEFWSKEYRFQHFDGTYADVMDRGYILRDDQGNPYRMIGAMMDITERKQAEAIILHQNEMLSSLHQITLDLLSYREINPLLDALVELAAKFMDASYAEIMLVDEEMLKVRAATQSQHYLIGQCVGREEALLSWEAVDTREPVVLSDYQRWPHRRAVYDPFQLHAVADFPILNNEQCLGVLALGREKSDYEFNLDQIQYGRLFANLTALVLNNAQLREALREQSIRDGLTGLYNRRYMEEALKQQLSRATRQLHPLGVILLDIDHFKRINDTYGHAIGDTLLRELGKLLKNHIRDEDIACRYGGEEFLLIMPDASPETTHQRAELLRQSAKGLRVEEDRDQLLDGITLSLGVAIYPQHGQTTESVLNAADTALYRAKQEGRDRVVMAGAA